MKNPIEVAPDDLFDVAFNVGWSSAFLAIRAKKIPRYTASLMWTHPGHRFEWEPLLFEKLRECKRRLREQFKLDEIPRETWEKCFACFQNGWMLGCSDTAKYEVDGKQT